MRVAYADPPYPGQSKKHYEDHRDYAGEVDHRVLLKELDTYDGWLLHTNSPSLGLVLRLAEEERIEGFRIMAWVKPFAAFKVNVPVAYAWEPVLIKPCRKPVVNHRVVMRDWVSANITMMKGLSGVKPESVCHWAFEMLGMEPEDSLDDMFPGSWAVSRAWATWKRKVRRWNELIPATTIEVVSSTETGARLRCE